MDERSVITAPTVNTAPRTISRKPIVADIDGTQRLQWGDSRGGTRGPDRGEHGHDDTERERDHEDLPCEYQSAGHAQALERVAVDDDRHDCGAERDAQYRSNHAEDARLADDGTVQLAFLRADRAQQRQGTAALGDQHLEGVGDDERRHEHREDAEAHEEHRNGVGTGLAERLERLIPRFLPGFDAVAVRQFLLDRCDGGIGFGFVDVQGHAGEHEVGFAVRPLKVRQGLHADDSGTAIGAECAIGVFGEAADRQLDGIAASHAGTVVRGEGHLVADVHRQLVGELGRQCDLLIPRRLMAFDHGDRQ